MSRRRREARRARRAAESAPRRMPSETRWLLGLLALAFVLKLLVVGQLADHPLLQADAGFDTTDYVTLAEQVRGGNLALGPGLYYVSPLYIYFLAGALGVLQSLTAVRVLQAALGTLTIGAIFLMARTWYGTRAAWWAAGLAALTGLLTFHEILILQSSLDAVLVAAALLALTYGLTRGDWRWGLAAGAAFGIASPQSAQHRAGRRGDRARPRRDPTDAARGRAGPRRSASRSRPSCCATSSSRTSWRSSRRTAA